MVIKSEAYIHTYIHTYIYRCVLEEKYGDQEEGDDDDDEDEDESEGQGKSKHGKQKAENSCKSGMLHHIPPFLIRTHIHANVHTYIHGKQAVRGFSVHIRIHIHTHIHTHLYVYEHIFQQRV